MGKNSLKQPEKTNAPEKPAESRSDRPLVSARIMTRKEYEECLKAKEMVRLG